VNAPNLLDEPSLEPLGFVYTGIGR
jgi:hypothetical protein